MSSSFKFSQSRLIFILNQSCMAFNSTFIVIQKIFSNIWLHFNKSSVNSSNKVSHPRESQLTLTSQNYLKILRDFDRLCLGTVFDFCQQSQSLIKKDPEKNVALSFNMLLIARLIRSSPSIKSIGIRCLSISFTQNSR